MTRKLAIALQIFLAALVFCAALLIRPPQAAYGLASFANGSSLYLLSDASVNNCVTTGSVTQFLWMGWIKWDNAHAGVSKYAVSETSATSAWTGIRINSGNVTYSIHNGSNNYTLHTPTLGHWYFYVVEVDGTTLNAWVGDDAGTLSKVADGVTVGARSTSVDKLYFGAMHSAAGYNLIGIDADILYWAGFRGVTTDATARASLYNGGAPAIWPAVFYVEHTAAAAPTYFHDFGQLQPLYKAANFGTMSHFGGTVTLSSNHAYWGTNRTVTEATVTGIPNCVAFWPFQDDADTAPVDVVNGYTLPKGSTNYPKRSNGGGVFGDYALLFTGAEYMIQPDTAVPALDISGTDAEVSVVVWYRDLMPNNNCNSLAQMWSEQGHRQYALFRSVNADVRYGFASHICSYTNNGGRSFNDWYNQTSEPYYNYEYSRDDWGSGNWSIDGVMRLGIMTYDGMALRTYRDGTYTVTAYPNGNETGCHTRGNRNPYISGDGGGISDVTSEFTVGARVTQTPGNYTEYTTGVIGGIAVYNRALTMREICVLAGLGTYPTVVIDTGDEQQKTQGDALTLESTIDEDGHTNAVTTWTSSIDGVLGTGDDLEINTWHLSPGTHTITCTSEEPAVMCSSTSQAEALVASAGVLDSKSITLDIESGMSYPGESGHHFHGETGTFTGSAGLHYRGE